MKVKAKLAAVLLPFHYSSEGVLHLSMIRRAPGGSHGGQLAFPGGKVEPEDSDMMDTALRETEEEVGLPRHLVNVIRPLEPLSTYTGYIIHPFIGLLQQVPTQWTPAPSEVAEVITVSMEELLAMPDKHSILHPESSEALDFPCFRVAGHPLWGASYKMLEPIIDDYLSERLDF